MFGFGKKQPQPQPQQYELSEEGKKLVEHARKEVGQGTIEIPAQYIVKKTGKRNPKGFIMKPSFYLAGLFVVALLLIALQWSWFLHGLQAYF